MAIGITVADLIESVVDQLTPSASPRMDVLASTLTTAAGTMALQYLDKAEVPPGSQLAVGTELMHVLDNTTASAIVVYRGFRSTTAKQHASGTQLWVGEAVARPLILRHIEAELASWPNQLFAVHVLELSAASGAESLDLDGAELLPEVRQLLRVELAPVNSSEDDRWLPLSNCRLRTRADTGTYPSGYALDLGGTISTATTVRVHLATDYDFSVLSTLSTDVEDVGLTRSQARAIPDCILYRLMQSGEVIRAQGGSAMGAAGSEQVPAEHSLRAQEGAYRVRQRRISTEVARLLAEYPIRERTRL